jgi:hypothetical protein
VSRYDWPGDTGRKERDDPGRRAGFLARRRTDFDPIGALEAGRASLAPHASGHGPFAPPSGRNHLWQPLGPMTVLRGQATGQPRIAGRVNALAVDASGTRVYAASGNGGVWYSGDAGSHWRSLGGFAPTNAGEVNRPAQRNSCGAIRVVFGATEADDDVYVGTGETAGMLPNAQPGQSLGGIGILFAHGPAASALDDPWRREAKNLIGRGVNRFAIEPAGTTVVAATSIGLLQRPNPAAADADWVRVAGTPFDTLTDECTDALWTAGAGARPARLWVWVRSGDNAGLWVRPQGATDFTRIATPGSTPRRAVLAASLPPDQIFVLNDAGSIAVPALYRISAAVAAAPAATAVAGVPNVLQGQGFYDIALAVHPALPNRIALGGCTFRATTPDGSVVRDGAVVVGDVAVKAGVLTFGHPTPFTMIGVGVHADVHDVAYSNNGDRIWASSDGGVYRSDNPTQQVGFFPCNDGLAIIESNYIANHPTCEGRVVTGLQDNGVIERLSNGVWRVVELGDGGSVVFDPLRPDRFISQYVNGEWRPSDGSFTRKALLTRGGTFAQKESDDSAFYSTAAGTAHKRGAPAPAAPNVGQIIVGTTRVWYTENFGAPWATPTGPASWVTLPTGTDPLPANPIQDDFGQAITVCRWQSPDVAWILGEGTLMRYARTPGSDNAGGPGSWTRETIIKKGVKNKKDATSADGPIRDSSVWTDIAVNLDPPPGPNQPPAQHGPKGAVYLGTIGKPDDANVDTLWWFDGSSKWFKTGLRTDASGVPAPVTAIVCDPAFPDEVYVGTTVGVWKGVRTQIGGANPAWTWAKRVNGLPEAAVEDLAIFSDSAGGLRLLRAAIAARGTWELRLDVADVVDLTYVRAHDDDLRYRPRAVEKKRDLITDRSWHGSPDVRPRRLSKSRVAPASLPWAQTTVGIDADALRRFQSALRSKSGDPRVRPTGAWDSYFNEVLRDLGAPLMPAPAPANTVCITTAFWNATMIAPHATAEPWGAGTPTEADILELTASLSEGAATQASCTLPAQQLKVDILVHHRGLDPVDGADVRVTLLWWADPRTRNAAKWNDTTTWFAGNVPWTPAVNQVLNSADGKTNQAVGTGWKFALGNNAQSHRVTLAGQTLDSTHSGVATFDLDVSSRRANSVVLVVAIIRAGTTPADDIALAPATLWELALTSPNVTVRSIRISS